jgi:mevalonate kinase
MKQAIATAPGKIILFGEHAVVYGQPALAAPLGNLTAEATITESDPGSGLSIRADDLGLSLSLAEESSEGLSRAARLALDHCRCAEPDAQISVSSSIPVASGLGSGAATSAALIKALAEYLGCGLEAEQLSGLVYEVEKLYHGTPSGIDNTVVCYEQPVFFVRGSEPDTFHIAQPFTLVIGDTGIKTPTHITVGAVRERWLKAPDELEAVFEQIGEITRQARRAIESGEVDGLGPLMGQNQAHLQTLGVSSPELDRLIESALDASALGAKLSGGGGGGIMIALVTGDSSERVGQALERAGAARVLRATIAEG